MQNYLLVFAGGGIGAVTRYWLSGLIHQRFGTEFPSGTLMVNIIGCFLIGVLMSMLEDRFVVYPSLRIFLTIGILGGFTTFSSFSFETVALLRDGEVFYASANVLLSVGTCLGGTWLGYSLGKIF
ncbi:MAG: fluoride efflux transporter CrcB [Ignavibacteriales bacterium]|nr:fluoride efflux transporter CrcB [Ignavibacteriales bacterium]